MEHNIDSFITITDYVGILDGSVHVVEEHYDNTVSLSHHVECLHVTLTTITMMLILKGFCC